MRRRPSVWPLRRVSLGTIGTTTSLERVPGKWAPALQSEINSSHFRDMGTFLQQERQSYRVYPPPDKVFAALEMCDLDQVRVVIVGQDPYHRAGQADGLAFSVPTGVAPPPSLRNIQAEICDDFGLSSAPKLSLRSWADQGVLLLNTVLTVREGKPKSHNGRGWEQFTTATLKAVSESRSGVVFMLWGAQAQRKVQHLDLDGHLVLTAPHPSPLSAYRGFFGCKHFSKANSWLVKTVQTEPVRWFDEEIEEATLGSDGGVGATEWKRQLEAIKFARRHRNAPVDVVGCHTLGKRSDKEEWFRFQTLVGLILSSRTRDEATALAMRRLHSRLPSFTPSTLGSLDEQEITNLIESVQFSKSKARYLKQTARLIQDKFSDEPPIELKEVLALPGVGPKVAHLYLQVACNRVLGISVDTHVHRIANILGWVSNTASPEHTRRELESWLPQEYWQMINPLLVGFGQQICKAIDPQCDVCPVRSCCPVHG